ncbi:hypothetical protein ACQ3I4_06795 [Zafaria sp. Z1313]|uniref:hypothetical protein n=1 Tax=unclassified Zafaria TaxID=2828765 RepID=UPI002E79FBEF|nr:hypothetical protein [Zafaria sp. J156]MEE1620472.1 hypothetical protein [Zafaria sp. J156]
MPTPKRVPLIARKSAFLRNEALGKGASRSQLRADRYDVPSRGLRINTEAEPDVREFFAAYSQLHGETYLSHTSAAVAWGMWLEQSREGVEPIHLTRRSGTAAAPRRRGVIGHRAPLTDADVRNVYGMRLTSPAWTWTDLAALGFSLQELVVAGDSLLQRADGPNRVAGQLERHPMSSITELRGVLQRRKNLGGIRVAREALGLLRERVDSRPESILRQIIVSAGFPEPIVNLPVLLPDGSEIVPDLQYPVLRIAIQYEGRHHGELDQIGKDIKRDFAFEAHGWTTVKADRAILTDAGRAEFLQRLVRALERQGGLGAGNA